MDKQTNSQNENRGQSTVDKSHNTSRLFWGLLLVLIGVLFILSNFGIATVNWSHLWRLWPLIIIMAGLSMLSLRGWLWRVVSFIAIISAMALIVWVAIFQSLPIQKSDSNNLFKTDISKMSDDVTEADIDIKAGAGNININSSSQKQIVTAQLDSSLSSVGQTNSLSNNIQLIGLTMRSNKDLSFNNINNNWDISLTRELPISVALDTGASNVNIDLSKVKLNDLSIKSGASSLNVKLGDLTDNVLVNTDAGASSIKLMLPKNSGVNLKIDGGLNSKQLADLTEVGDNNYQSPGYDTAPKRINITSKVGVSSLTIQRY